jgi:hypothetical protein
VVQRYDGKTGQYSSVGAKIEPLFLAHRLLLLLMRVSSSCSQFMPVCGRVTMLPHPPKPFLPCALCSAVRPSRQVASLRFTLAWQISYASSTSSLIVLSPSLHGRPRSTMPPSFYHTLSMTTSQSSTPCLMPATLSLSFLDACAQPLAYHYSQPANPRSVHSSLTPQASKHCTNSSSSSALHPALVPLSLFVWFALHRSRIATECEIVTPNNPSSLGRIAFPILHVA